MLSEMMGDAPEMSAPDGEVPAARPQSTVLGQHPLPINSHYFFNLCIRKESVLGCRLSASAWRPSKLTTDN
jgi:hypothetical protein